MKKARRVVVTIEIETTEKLKDVKMLIKDGIIEINQKVDMLEIIQIQANLIRTNRVK